MFIEHEKFLADFALRSAECGGRRFQEKEHLFRNEFQRDRDRVIHSRAFRQLEAKTQVFIQGSESRIRTRLTHTIEVAAIARTLARALKVNEDLTETIALAHDLGHPPFGHCGERKLNEIMKESGGFDHNLQALRIVDKLEIKYPFYDGLNLTYETRAGLLKHRDKQKAFLDGGELPRNGSIEAQIADIADDLTYMAHDIDDGLAIGILNDDFLRETAVWNYARETALENGADPSMSSFLPFVVRCFIDNAVADVVAESKLRLRELSPKSNQDVRNYGSKVVSFRSTFEKEMNVLKNFLYTNIYFSPKVSELSDSESAKLELIFDSFKQKPEKMGKDALTRVESDGLMRTVCDHVASLTDPEAQAIFSQISQAKY